MFMAVHIYNIYIYIYMYTCIHIINYSSSLLLVGRLTGWLAGWLAG